MLRRLLPLLIIVSVLLAQDEPAHKCDLLGGQTASLGVTRSGDRLIEGVPAGTLDESYVSPSGAFRIHYTQTGDHAVDNPDNLAVPPFILETATSADYVYSLITQELGFNPPPDDGGLDGDELDIYVRDWNGQYYGMTYFDWYVARPQYDGYPSYLVLDEDYAEGNYATQGLEALRVTIAHEFFHMVQLGYAHPGELSGANISWYEISSVWMEEYCYPEIDDYHAYVQDNFRLTTFPDLMAGTQYAYGHGIFGQVLDLEYGVQDGKHIMLEAWEALHGEEALPSLGNILEQAPWNSSLLDALSKYAVYNVFTGSRALSSEYYPDAADLPELWLNTTTLPDSSNLLPMSYELRDTQISYKRFQVPAFSDLYVRANDLNSDLRLYLISEKAGELPSLKSALLGYWIPLEDVATTDAFIVPMINGSLESTYDFELEFESSNINLDDEIQALWPNPSYDGTIHMAFSLTQAGQTIIRVYNILGQEVLESIMELPSEGIYEFTLNLNNEWPSGMYILQLRQGRTYLTHKFVVLK